MRGTRFKLLFTYEPAVGEGASQEMTGITGDSTPAFCRCPLPKKVTEDDAPPDAASSPISAVTIAGAVAVVGVDGAEERFRFPNPDLTERRSKKGADEAVAAPGEALIGQRRPAFSVSASVGVVGAEER